MSPVGLKVGIVLQRVTKEWLQWYQRQLQIFQQSSGRSSLAAEHALPTLVQRPPDEKKMGNP